MIHVLIHKDGLSTYLFKDLEGVDTIFLPIKKHNPLFHRFIKAIYYKVSDKIYSYYYPKEITERLAQIPSDDCLIVFGEDTYTYWMLSHLCSDVRNKVAYFWNPCSTLHNQKVCKKVKRGADRAGSIVNYIRSLGFKIATFDEGDAIKYNMHYFSQFYRPNDTSSQILNYKQDFFFCGRDKGRKDIINKMKDLLSQLGVCRFIIPGVDGEVSIEYDEYLRELHSSRVICEVVQLGQVGMTVRSVEALFHKKKMITNNTDILRYEFYHPNNILVVSMSTDKETVTNFLNLPYYEISSEIMSHFSVYTMLNDLANIKIYLT